MKKILVIITIFLACLTLPVKAYTKEDIINLASSIKPCDNKTKALIRGAKSSYERILNERDVTQANLDIIYNNIGEVKRYIESNGFCSVTQADKVSAEARKYFTSLYETTNNILLSSPKISDGTVPKTNVVIDPNTGRVDIYEDGAVSEKINTTDTLNAVGFNSSFTFIYIEILVFSILYIIILAILKKRKIRSKFFTGLVFVNVFVLIIFTIFRNEVSIGMDLIDTMSLQKKSGATKEIVLVNKKIVSYPSYGSKYAKIKILEESANVYFGDSSDVLAKGVGQSSLYKFPGEGKTVLSGHNTGAFKMLYQLRDEDEVTIETVYGKFTYVVDRKEVIDYKDLNALEENYDLILYTCYPEVNIYGNKRLIVYLKLTDSSWVGDNSEE